MPYDMSYDSSRYMSDMATAHFTWNMLYAVAIMAITFLSIHAFAIGTRSKVAVGLLSVYYAALVASICYFAGERAAKYGGVIPVAPPSYSTKFTWNYDVIYFDMMKSFLIASALYAVVLIIASMFSRR